MKGDTYKKTIHDGSVSYSVTLPAPEAGRGKHAKTAKQDNRRAWCSAWARKLKSMGIKNAYAQARAFVYADIYQKR